MPHVHKIISPKNPHIKSALDLRDRRVRETTGLILVEGYREILRAQEAKVVFEKIFACPEYFHHQECENIIEDFKKTKTQILETSKKVFSRISFGERKEGLLAICRKPQATWQELKLTKNPIIVVVEAVEKPGNLGAILRSCDGAGVSALILCEEKVDQFNPYVIRASLGTVFSLQVIESVNGEALRFFHHHKIMICATLIEAETIYSNADFSQPIAIVLGCEGKGLSDFWVKNSDVQVKIPMHGKADSLNVSNTAAILLYEVLRQRSLSSEKLK